jgi:RNA polymerase sigma factor (sigma-70 family)
LNSLALKPASGVGDLSDLYATLSGRLERIVRVDVRAPDAVIEDACQVAWSRLIHHGDRVCRDAALSWLATTAVREAIKLVRREGRDWSLEETFELVGDAGVPSSAAGPDELCERSETLRSLAALPERQRRFLWLHALGLTYAEIATREGCTLRTVERQLLRAKAAARALAEASGNA